MYLIEKAASEKGVDITRNYGGYNLSDSISVGESPAVHGTYTFGVFRNYIANGISFVIELILLIAMVGLFIKTFFPIKFKNKDKNIEIDSRFKDSLEKKEDKLNQKRSELDALQKKYALARELSYTQKEIDAIAQKIHDLEKENDQ